MLILLLAWCFSRNITARLPARPILAVSSINGASIIRGDITRINASYNTHNEITASATPFASAAITSALWYPNVIAPKWLLAAIVIAKRLSPIAITSVNICTASLTSEMLLLKIPPTASITATAVVTANDNINILLGRSKLVPNVDSLCCFSVFTDCFRLMGKLQPRGILVFYNLRSSFFWVDAIDKSSFGHSRVLQGDHDYLAIL